MSDPYVPSREDYLTSALLAACARAGFTEAQTIEELSRRVRELEARLLVDATKAAPRAIVIAADHATRVLVAENDRLREELAGYREAGREALESKTWVDINARAEARQAASAAAAERIADRMFPNAAGFVAGSDLRSCLIHAIRVREVEILSEQVDAIRAAKTKSYAGGVLREQRRTLQIVEAMRKGGPEECRVAIDRMLSAIRSRVLDPSTEEVIAQPPPPADPTP